MGIDRSDLIPTNIRLAAANQGEIYVTGRTPIISLQLGGRHLWMSFLVVENLDESDQFILGRDFVRLSSCSNFPERPTETELAAN